MDADQIIRDFNHTTESPGSPTQLQPDLPAEGARASGKSGRAARARLGAENFQMFKLMLSFPLRICLDLYFGKERRHALYTASRSDCQKPSSSASSVSLPSAQAKT